MTAPAISVTSSCARQFSTSVRGSLISECGEMLTIRLVAGFLTKIKKLLETVCHNCGKIKANTVSHPFRDGDT